MNACAEPAQKLQETRTRDLQQWLDSPLLHDTLALYDKEHLVSGIACTDQVGLCLHGLNSCPIGQAWLNRQADSKSLDESNLLLNGMLLYFKPAIDAFLKSGVLSGVSMDKVQESLKAVTDVWAKFNDLAQSAGKGGQHGSTVTTTQLGGVNLLLVQGGHVMLANMPGGKFLDQRIARSKVLHGLLKLSMGKVLTKELDAAYSWHQAMLQARTGAAQQAQSKQINAMLKTASGSSDMNSLRFGVLVALLELGNVLLKVGAQHNSPSTRAAVELSAASLAMGAVLLEITGGICEKMSTDNNLSLASSAKVTTSALKLTAGGLGAVGGVIGGILDFDSAADELAKRRGKTSMLFAVYALRGTVSISGGLVSAGIALGAAGPFLEWLLAKTNGPFYKTVLRFAIKTSATLAAERMALMLLRGARLFTVAGVALTVAIWLFSDDALEDWCDKSCLRKDRKNEGFKNAQEESAALDKAVLEVS